MADKASAGTALRWHDNHAALPLMTIPVPQDRTDATAPGTSPATLEQRRRQFLRFAETECGDDPLYVALCRLLAERPAALALLDQADGMQQRPNLLLAAIHERVLDGAGGALAAWYPSVGGSRAAEDPALPGALDELLTREHAALAAHCASRATQTNEIGRCAVLWPALAQVAAATGGRPLALLDFGCSAGLNLGVDRYRYSHGAERWGADDPAAPLIACHPVGGAAPPRVAPARIATRLGLDPAPVDLRDDAAVRWLRACLWPHDRARRERFDAAVAIVRAAGWLVRAERDCAAAIEPWLDTLPGGVQPVVFNSWVLAYFTPAARAAHIARMQDLVARRGIAWLSAEGPGLLLGDLPPAPAADDRVSAAEIANASLWWLSLPGAAPRLVARSHAHGRWAHWATETLPPTGAGAHRSMPTRHAG